MQNSFNFLSLLALSAFLSIFFSITVFQFLAALFIVLAIALRARQGFPLTLKGKLFAAPLLGHLAAINLSSFLFLRVKDQWRKLAEQNFFSLSYFAAFSFGSGEARKLLELFTYAAVAGGTVLSIKVLGSYFLENKARGFWGGSFVVGNLLALSLFSALYLFKKYRLPLLKTFFAAAALLFSVAATLPGRRSVILGFAVGFLIMGAALWLSVRERRRRAALLAVLTVLFASSAAVFVTGERFQRWKTVIQEKGLTEATLNTISSSRVQIALGAWDLTKKALEEGDYLKLLIGWGYGPQKQYRNLPKKWMKEKINEYESFLLISEFINGGLLNVIFIIWFYAAAVFLTVKALKRAKEDLLPASFMAAVWVNLTYHLFTIFWVPVNAIYLLILGLVERTLKEKN